jgi:hypothetical protein
LCYRRCDIKAKPLIKMSAQKVSKAALICLCEIESGQEKFLICALLLKS